MIDVRPEHSDDYDSIASVLSQAFGQDNEARLVERLRADPGFQPDLSLVAVDQNEIVGHILFAPIWVDAPECESYSALALAPLSVRPDKQNQGIGSALCRAGITRCQGSNFEHVIVLGHSDYYPRFGFVPAARYNIKPPFPVDSNAFMILLLNEQATPRPGVVRYPPAFEGI